MKTAMQIAIENIDKCLNSHDTKDMLINLLEKEKEQICNAYVEGLEGLWISAEEYYNREFNQNK
jgi:hypothetical protein